MPSMCRTLVRVDSVRQETFGICFLCLVERRSCLFAALGRRRRRHHALDSFSIENAVQHPPRSIRCASTCKRSKRTIRRHVVAPRMGASALGMSTSLRETAWGCKSINSCRTIASWRWKATEAAGPRDSRGNLPPSMPANAAISADHRIDQVDPPGQAPIAARPAPGGRRF